MKVTFNVKTKEAKIEEFIPPIRTPEQVKQERICEIMVELEELDKIVNRATEDTIEELYNQFGYVPYSKTADTVNRKEDLRAELQELKGGE